MPGDTRATNFAQATDTAGVPFDGATEAKQDDTIANQTDGSQKTQIVTNVTDPVGVQNPLPVDGDSIYIKDLDLDRSDIGTFTGNLEDLFGDPQAVIEDNTATNPKTFSLYFFRPVRTTFIGLVAFTGNYSNTKIILKDVAGVVVRTLDFSTNNTDFTAFSFEMPPTTFIEAEFEFHTADAVQIAGCFIPKERNVISRLKATSDLSGLSEDVNSFRGALNVNNALVHKVGINEYFFSRSGTTTTLSGAASEGDTTINVTNAAAFSVGDKIRLEEDPLAEQGILFITAIVANAVTLDRPIANDYTTAAEIEIVENNMSLVVGSVASPISYRITPPTGAVWQMTRVLISITSTTAMDDAKFGGIPALTNGVVIKGETSVRTAVVTNWKSNTDMINDMFDIEYSSKAPAGSNGLRGRWTFTKAEFIIEMDGDNGDFSEILIQDDLTALSTFTIKAQGRLFGA